ncbi:MAG TPA: hypothetical protein VFX76_01165, partial [Roseiflexaceae bacterium]|nr:hypothetical protein [Roseiflexaceae bacterium]
SARPFFGKLFALSRIMIALHALPARDCKMWVLTVKKVCGRIAQISGCAVRLRAKYEIFAAFSPKSYAVAILVAYRVPGATRR